MKLNCILKNKYKKYFIKLNFNRKKKRKVDFLKNKDFNIVVTLKKQYI